MRLRRSWLYMPATDRRKIEKAAGLAVDCVCIDLEDGVAPAEKEAARLAVPAALHDLDFGSTERWVRINGVDTGLAAADLEAALAVPPDGIVLPKVETAAQVSWAAERLAAHEAGGTRLALAAIIETARGVVNLREICEAAGVRLDVLVFGAEDFAASVGARRTPAGWEVFHARSAVVMHAAAYGLAAVDMVYPDFRDAEGFLKQARQGVELGYGGKQLIHPNQVPLIHEVYTPTPGEVAAAQRVVDGAAAHQAQGRGAFALDGRMIDSPLVKAAEWILARARASGKPEGD